MQDKFKEGDVVVLIDNKKSTLVFSIGSKMQIVKLSHKYKEGAYTVLSLESGMWKDSTGYCFPEEIRPLTPLEKLL